jgi:hypothetical protein
LDGDQDLVVDPEDASCYSEGAAGQLHKRGRMEGQSVFHTTTLAESVEKDACSTAVADYLTLMRQFCGAGTHTAATFAELLRDTAYGDIAGQFHLACQEIEHAVKDEAQSVNTEVEKLWDRVGQPGHDHDNNNVGHDIQLVAKGFGRIFQLHCQFFLTSSETLAHFTKLQSVEEFLNSPAPSATATECSEDDIQSTANSASKSTAADCKAAQTDSPRGIRKQISSFLSKKLGRSGSPNSELQAQSMFYVDVPIEARGENKGTNVLPSGKESHAAGGNARNQHDNLTQDIDAHLQNLTLKNGVIGVNETGNQLKGGGSCIVRPKESGKGYMLTDGQVATQEELDSVIDFLSGVHKGGGASMQSIPENPAAQNPMSRAVGSQLMPQTIFNTPPPPLNMAAGDAMGMALDIQSGVYGRRSGQHRRSDGGLMAENVAADVRTNTWPYRPNPRPAGADNAMGDFHIPYPTYHTFDGLGGSDLEYSRYLASVNKQMKQAGGSGLGNMVPPQGPWANATPPGSQPLNKSWPHNLFANDGLENATRNWSTAGDSSSCSDESSSGEVPWMMGHDLMVGPPHHKRRHSSGGEETFPGYCAAPVMPPGGEVRPRSVEDLLEPKSTNTWPPKQPWAKPPPAVPQAPPGGPHRLGQGSGELGGHGGTANNPIHPPLGMQWSDPLTNRPLSTWGTGWCTEKV